MRHGDSGWQAFWLTLFAIGAAALLAGGWQDRVPFTAAAFVVFFVSRVWRSLIKRPAAKPMDDDPVRRANRFIMVTALGWLGSGVLGAVAALTGEGQEWLYVAPFFLAMGALNLYIAVRSPDTTIERHGRQGPAKAGLQPRSSFSSPARRS